MRAWPRLNAYDKRISAIAGEWQERKGHYADGFRRDLDIKIEEYARRVGSCCRRVDFADASAKRKQTLRRAGNTSQAEEEAAISAHRELLSSLSDATMALQRLRNRRELAGKGVYLQEDGKEPEWSWRSLDEPIAGDATDGARGARGHGGGRDASGDPGERADEPERGGGRDLQGAGRHDDLVDRGQQRHLCHPGPAALHLDRLLQPAGRRAGDRYAGGSGRRRQPRRGLFSKARTWFVRPWW